MDVSIVIYKPRWDELGDTLESLHEVACEFGKLRLLLSGGNEDFERLSNLVRSWPAGKVNVVHRYDNLGFAGGQNLLLHESFMSGVPNVLVFNPDIQVVKGSLAQLATYGLELDSKLVGPIILQTREAKIDSAGIYWTRDGRHLDYLQGQQIPDSPSAQVVSGLTGACLLVSRKVHDLITQADGYFFDPAFIAYREDADLGVRAAIYGCESMCVPVTGISHSRKISGGARTNGLVNLLSVQNRFLMRWKLASARPGKKVPSWLRDLTVLTACLTIERSSLPGIRQAFKIRRLAKYSGPRQRVRASHRFEEVSR